MAAWNVKRDMFVVIQTTMRHFSYLKIKIIFQWHLGDVVDKKKNHLFYPLTYQLLFYCICLSFWSDFLYAISPLSVMCCLGKTLK